MARPTILTPEIQGRICEALTGGNYFAIACEYAGIARSTGYEWLRRAREEADCPEEFLEFSDAVKNAEAEAEVRNVTIINQVAQGVTMEIEVTDPDGTVRKVEIYKSDPNWQAAMTFLERSRPKRWGRKVMNEISGPSDEDGTPGPIKIEDSKGAVLAMLGLDRPDIEEDTPDTSNPAE